MTEENKKPTSRRGANLSQADRERGGRQSASKQVRDARGQFAGSRDKLRNQPASGVGTTDHNRAGQNDSNNEDEQTASNAQQTNNTESDQEQEEGDRGQRHH
jgi:hypothetical protein